MDENKLKSLWLESERMKSFPQLKNDVEADVAIIGGGMAGILAAYFLSKERENIVIIEANKILSHTSGNTTAKVTCLHEDKYAYLEEKFELENAKTYFQANQWAIDELERIVLSEKIDCDFKRVPGSMIAVTSEGLERLKAEYSTLQKITPAAFFLMKDEKIPMLMKGRLKIEDQAIFHPAKFLNKIVDILQNRGVKIFENSRVIDLEENEKHLLKTKKALILAKKVIIATNYPVFDKAAFFLRMNQMRSYALAVEIDGLFPDEIYVGIDGAGITMRPCEIFGKKLVVFGGKDHVSGQLPDKNPFGELEMEVRKYFKIKSVEYYWAAQDSMPIDRVPYIGKMPLAENIFLATGFGEWGMTTSFVSAKILSDLIKERENKWTGLYSPARLKFIASKEQTGAFLKNVAKGFGSHLAKTKNIEYEKIEKGEGGVFQEELKKVAAYKDMKGNVHKVSAICPHKGCIVNFNQFEKSWDCPCHGSRFSTEGEILNDPTIKPLKKHINH